jgi:hypothetical protein
MTRFEIIVFKQGLRWFSVVVQHKESLAKEVFRALSKKFPRKEKFYVEITGSLELSKVLSTTRKAVPMIRLPAWARKERA